LIYTKRYYIPNAYKTIEILFGCPPVGFTGALITDIFFKGQAKQKKFSQGTPLNPAYWRLAFTTS